MRFGRGALILCLLLVPMEAKTGRIHYRYVSLEDLVGRAPVIVMAKRLPDSRRETRLFLGDEVEPITLIEERYQVVETLRGPSEMTAGSEFGVTSFDYTRFKLTLEYRTRGLSRSPVIQAYNPDPIPTYGPDDVVILFLERRVLMRLDESSEPVTVVDSLATVCSGAAETSSKRDRVVSLAATLGASDRLEIVVAVPHGHGAAEDALDDEVRERLRGAFPRHQSFSWRYLQVPREFSTQEQ